MLSSEAPITDQAAFVADEPPIKPYGWIGLPLSLLGILLLGMVFVAIVLGVAYGIEVARVEWGRAAIELSGFKDSLKGDPIAAEFVLLCFSILTYLAIAAAVLVFAGIRGGRRWRDLVAWRPWHLRKCLRFFAAIAAIILVYSFVANEALGYFYPASQDWVKLPTGVGSIALFVAVATFAAPLAEELVFRGWLYTALRAKLWAWPSLLISSALFALAHWEDTHLYALVVFPVGLALGLIRERTGSVKATMTFHAFYNGVACILLGLGH